MICLDCSLAVQSEGPDKDASLAPGASAPQGEWAEPGADTTPPSPCEGLCGAQTPTAAVHDGGGEPRVFADPSDGPSSIAFSDCDCPRGGPPGRDPAPPFVSESSDGGESSSGNEEDNEDENEEEDDDEDDVFTELPQYREFLISRRRRSASRGRPKRNGPLRRDVPSPDAWSSSSSSSQEAEPEPRGEEASPLVVLSPWSDSMTQLMKKLDQLNMDIEEALSGGSSPSDTPAVARKQMPGVDPGTPDDPDQGEGGASGQGSQNGGSSSSSSSSCLRRNPRGGGARARKTKGTARMSQAGAADKGRGLTL
ncbi:hypothetical protein ANANG_G00164930 [Anguilla anguilla]|uniref:Uncharacterized protein n=1 Tax=Anguilla anguilla TaxID=7936 RepID=A0A9D3M917_ANGAN|nr:hypothetical protein ANANG_G00164930 [Anguilla anguilla]